VHLQQTMVLVTNMALMALTAYFLLLLLLVVVVALHLTMVVQVVVQEAVQVHKIHLKELVPLIKAEMVAMLM